jgi:hypothetical protein
MNLALCYKNFAANANISHIGLGVSALNTSKVLKRHGVNATAFAINSVNDLDAFLVAHPQTTHVVVAAAWLPALDLGKLAIRYPGVEFACNIHSNVGFLQADANGVALLGSYVHLQRELLNFRVSGNNSEFVNWLTLAYTVEAEYLPNLYDLDSTVPVNRPVYNGGALRIGAFGASRPLKNFMSAAGAAVAIAKELRVPVEFWMSGGRPEGGAAIERAISALIASQASVTLNVLNWSAWPEFLDHLETMHLMIQVSYSESFNIVTADGIARGVPSVVSEVITWAPKRWVARIDDSLDVARVGRSLITDPYSAIDGVKALERHNQLGFYEWTDFLSLAPVGYSSAVTTKAIR